MKAYRGAAWLVFLMILLSYLLLRESSGQMCGDCNSDGRVTISELVKAINNSLNLDCAECDEDCQDGECRCLGSCRELLVVDGIRFDGSFCAINESITTQCHAIRCSLTPQLCHDMVDNADEYQDQLDNCPSKNENVP